MFEVMVALAAATDRGDCRPLHQGCEGVVGPSSEPIRGGAWRDFRLILIGDARKVNPCFDCFVRLPKRVRTDSIPLCNFNLRASITAGLSSASVFLT